MNSISSSTHLRRSSAAALSVCAVALALVLGPQAALASPSQPDIAFDRSAPIAPYIIGGQEASISQFPWQVYVEGGPFKEGGKTFSTSCGGSILDSTHILTAAHCVDVEGTTAQHPAAAFVVASGDSDINSLSSTTQVVVVASIRTHPYYEAAPEIKDDVAVLTLEAPLELTTAMDAQSISLVPAGATPAPGTTFGLSGYGKQNGAEGVQPDGKLYATTLTAISSDACRSEVKLNSAVLLCAESPDSSGCQGDSGGPLTDGTPVVEVGIVDFGGRECPIGHPSAFTNIAAPEIQEFIRGSESPPVAARPTSPPVIKSVGPVPVALGPLTCEPGVWSGSPTFTYTFQAENGSGQALQSGAANVFTPPATLVGTPIVCIVQAGNPGGVTTFRSGTTPALATDTTPPSAAISTLRCKFEACVVTFTASDVNGVALSVAPTAVYSVVVKCPKKKKKKGRPPVCHKTRTSRMSVQALPAGSFQAGITRLPYGEKVTFEVAATNAAGLKARSVSVSTTLHKPKPKPKPKPRRKKKKKR